MTFHKGTNLGANLAANLKRLRTRKKMSLRAFGQTCGLSGVYVWQIEAGIRQPTLGTVLQIANALEVGVNDLLKPVKPKPAKG